MQNQRMRCDKKNDIPTENVCKLCPVFIKVKQHINTMCAFGKKKDEKRDSR